jgi:uncharacterized glyoxalase superfamily protein PhnB
MSETKTSVQTFYPGLRYADPRSAMDWLIATFGFAEDACYTGDDGTIAHAQLRFGDGVVMLGTERDDGYPISSPKTLGGLTGSIYVAVPPEEIDAHYARAKAAGAKIHTEIEETAYGSRSYAAFDPEGFLWSFGTYRP